MSIEYTYEIVSVDVSAKCMEIIYTAAGRDPMHIGARLPWEGETLEAVVDMYAPVSYWTEQTQSVVVPLVGETGVISPPPVVEVTNANAAMWEQIELEKKIAKALVKFGVLSSDPTEIPVTGL